ncbi:MAG: PEP-CTERM sorting domain-containing protein [bacterium]|nr:PEP-CTERM sorting domain-containing protein [bacterium]
MSFNRLVAILATVFAFLCASNAAAFTCLPDSNCIYLNPDTQDVLLGNTFQVDLMMDFSDVTVGGGVEITYDPLVLFQSFAFDPSFVGDFGLSSPTNNSLVQPLEIGFGFFVLSEPHGESGLHTVGSATFLAIGTGTLQMITTGSSASSPGPFYDPLSTPLSVNFGSSSVDITPIPEPSTAALIGLGLATLAIQRRRATEG